MAKWISQREVPSITPATRRRTNYLAPLAERVRGVIQEVLDQNPDTEDVTLAVLEALQEPLKALATDRDRERLNQDVGLLVAQTLVDVYGPERVSTLRAEDGRAVSTRRNTRPGLSDVKRFTPHRVQRTRSLGGDRILLDTIVVNNILCEHPSALDVQALKEGVGAHPISLADGAFAEIARGLATRKIPVERWARRIAVINDILDPELPVAPGGTELAAFIGLRPMCGIDFEGMRAYYRGVWAYLCSRRTPADLEKSGSYTDAAGRRYAVKLDAAHIESVFEDVGLKWANWVQEAGAKLSKLLHGGEQIDEEELRQLIRVFLGMDMKDAELDKLDLAVRVIAARTREAAVNGYRPTKPNDAIDFDLLWALPLPAIVCTQDTRLIQLATRTGSADAWRLMTPSALLDWLAKKEGSQDPSASVEEALSPQAQQDAWKRWALCGPQGPIEDEAVGWP
jgi:hypothetical protein